MLTLAGVVALDPYSRREYGNGRKKSAVNVSLNFKIVLLNFTVELVSYETATKNFIFAQTMLLEKRVKHA